MPYILPEDRVMFDEAITEIVDAIMDEDSETARSGMLNYVISSIIAELIDEEGMTYNRLNTYMGVLECAKQELYRRVAAPYEDKKAQANGDVF